MAHETKLCTEGRPNKLVTKLQNIKYESDMQLSKANPDVGALWLWVSVLGF